MRLRGLTLSFGARVAYVASTVGMAMNINRFRLFGFCALVAASVATAGCGDVGSVQIEIDFPDEDTEIRTRAILLRAREVPVGRSGCEDLWGGQPADLKQKEAVIEYPNRTDIRALGIDLSLYDALTFFAFAHTSLDVTNTPAIAGGCTEAPVSGDSTSNIVIQLEPAP